MRRNHGHKSFHIPWVKQYFHFQELQRVKKSFTNLPKVCMKSHNDQHQCKKKKIPYCGRGDTPLPPPHPPRSHRSLGSVATLPRFAPIFTEFLDPPLPCLSSCHWLWAKITRACYSACHATRTHWRRQVGVQEGAMPPCWLASKKENTLLFSASQRPDSDHLPYSYLTIEIRYKN